MGIMPKISHRIVLREEGDEGLVFDSESGVIRIVNDVAMYIWNLCDGRHSQDEIVANIMKEFDVDSPEKVKADIGLFLEKLEKHGLLEA